MKLIGVPFATLVRMYNDASTLARSENKIVKAPDEGDNLPRYVANSISNLPPYQVSQKRTARNCVYYECSEGCIRFSAYALCEHTIAVADIDNRLSDFLKAYKMKNGGKRDMNAIVHIDMPAGRGRKKTKSTQKRKGASNRKKQLVQEYSAPADTSQQSLPQPENKDHYLRVSFLRSKWNGIYCSVP